MHRSKRTKVDVLIVLMSLVAEGTPQLALQLAREWKANGFEVQLMVLQQEPLDMLEDFNLIGIPIHFSPMGRGLSRYINLLIHTYTLCRTFSVRSIMSFPLGWHAFTAIGARLAGTRHICAYVGNPPPIWTGSSFQKFKFLVQLGRPFTSKLICCSDYLYDLTIRDFQVSAFEATTIYNSCDLEAFVSPKPRSPIPATPPRVVMTARLEVHKDQPTLIRAASILKSQGTPVEVWLIGEGSRRPELEQLINQLELNDYVKLLGSRRDVADLLSQCDVFAFQALKDEGFGIALAEAMAAKVPIVATDVGACREVLLGNTCGLLVKERDPSAMAKGILHVLSNKTETQQRVKAAYERAISKFSVPESAVSYGRELGFIL
ncbi:glycosyltransferase [Synechococcus sp. MIT S9452]|uniref:glycosyltransferase n=1 Tax=Synechococcus sp. MIT S9452 TaxID=3082546 RepID=UPI0039A6A8B9